MEEVTFWSTVAQLAPVLALALVIESRLAAARFKDPEKFRSQKWARLYYAVSFLAAFVVLTLAFVESLVRLRNSDAHFLDSQSVTIGLMFVFAILIQLPVQTIVGALVADWVIEASQAVPWSMTKRRKRRVRRMYKEVDSVERALRNSRLEAWGVGADLLVRMSRTIRSRPTDRVLLQKYDYDLAHLVVGFFELSTRRHETERVVDEVRQELAEISSAASLDSLNEDLARRLADLS